MDELARKCVETRYKKIVEELYELARELEKMKMLESGEGPDSARSLRCERFRFGVLKFPRTIVTFPTN